MVIEVTDIPAILPPAGIVAVALNVAVLDADAPGFVTLYPCGERQLVANVNYVPNRVVSNAVTAAVSPTGTVCLYSSQRVHVVVDLSGWYETGAGYNGSTPTRVFDTRPGESPAAARTVPKTRVGGANVLEVQVTDIAGAVPASGAGAVALNVAVVPADAAGFVTVWPCGPRPFVASLNHGAGEIRSNAVIASVSPRGTVCFASHVPVDLVVDVNGWFATRRVIEPFGPARLLDTRPGESPNALIHVPPTQVGAAFPAELRLRVQDVPGLSTPTRVGAVVLNVAATNAGSGGHLTVHPCGERPIIANLNYARLETVSNSVVAPVSSTGWFCIWAFSSTDIVVDITGWLPAE
jgi:hypothetical protein